MARKKKIGFDTLELTTDFLSDSDVVKIHQNIGASGVVILLSIYLQAFKRQGYYLPVNRLTLGIVCGDSSSTLDTVNSAIEKMLDMGIFHRGLYENHGILTSAKLQEMYIAHSKTIKRKVDIAPEYSLVDANNGTSNGKEISGDELLELSRNIVKNWNALHKDDEWERKRVPEDLITMPEFLEALQAIVKKYDDAADTATWIDLERIAFNQHPHLGLGQIIGHEPSFIMLYNMRGHSVASTSTVPAPATKEEENTTKQMSTIVDTIVDYDNSEQCDEPMLDATTPVAENIDYSGCEWSDTMDTQAYKIETVFVANASVVEADTVKEEQPQEQQMSTTVDNIVIVKDKVEDTNHTGTFAGFFAGRNDDIRDTDGTPLESPEDRRKRETAQREREAQARIDAEFEKEDDNYEVVGEDAELSPLIRNVACLFNEKYGAQNYPNPEQYHVDADLFTHEKNTLEFFRVFIEYDERCKDIEFWDLLIDGMIYLHKVRGIGNPDNPRIFFDVDYFVDDIYGNTGTAVRVKWLELFIDYVCQPEKCGEYLARETGKQFIEMREKRKQIEEEERRAVLEKNQVSATVCEGETNRDREIPVGDIAGNSAVSSADLEWLKRREEHPELFKDPTKEFGDRTGTAPWSLKNPPSADTVLADPDYLDEFEHGTSIRSLA